AILVLGAITEGAAAAKQARDLGIKARLLGVVAFAYNDFIKLGGSAVEGTIACTTFFPSNPDPKVQAFVKKYKEKYNEEPDHAAAHTYDALQLLIQAIKNGQLDSKDLAADRQKIRDELLKVNNYQGVSAPITYGPNDHDGYQELMLIEVKNGEWQVIK
ncbi:MAG: branched-chain amino acid transport system substrate-binding protein, partial [Clostridia bacterium]|nr:branched-chain amino acid transport system substrate-binding protein [Clostridia bacterium]